MLEVAMVAGRSGSAAGANGAGGAVGDAVATNQN